MQKLTRRIVNYVRNNDTANRVRRTFIQGATGVFLITYVGPLMTLLTSLTRIAPGEQLPDVDLTFWRNAVVAIFAGGVIAVVSLIQNMLNTWLGKTKELGT